MKRRASSFFPVVAVIFAALLPFSPSASAATETILHSFQPTLHGQYPNGGLISDSAGNLYGVTQYGGAYDYGAVYMLSPNAHGAWTETLLYSFKGQTAGSTDGWYPNGTLTFDSVGNLYGATTWGGNPGFGPGAVGTVFKLTKSNGKWIESVLWSFQQFNSNDGFNAQGGLIFDKSGNLYGTTRQGGGADESGIIFRLSPSSHGKWKETILHVFNAAEEGYFPGDSLTIDASSNLYGTTTGNNGTVFKLANNGNDSWTLTTLYTFTVGADGANPSGGLIFDSAGNLDGTTSDGGTGTGCYDGSPCGTVFQLVPESNGQWSEKVLYSFNGTDGAAPEGTLLLDQSGNLYGTTGGGGSLGFGTAFKLTYSSGQWNESVLWNFTGGSGGQNPQYGVIAGTAGQLYGASTYIYSSPGEGTVFELTTNASGTWSETTLTTFPAADGGLPQASLIADSSGNLYGVTSQYGSNAFGTVFKLERSSKGWKESILYNFTSGTSAGTYFYSDPSNLILDSSGNLYGETSYGGSAGDGMVFELSPDSGGKWTEKTLLTFTSTSTGTRPFGGLIFDSEGNLYGTTESGGTVKNGCASGCGTVFKLSPAPGAWTETILYNFAGGSSDGSEPSAGVIFDQAGNLYGTTSFGGIKAIECGGGCGTVFKLTPNAGGAWTESLLYEFTGAQGDGGTPDAGVIFDQAGNLYGTTSLGGNHGYVCGTNGCGIVYELSPHSGNWSQTVLYTFQGTEGAFPVAGLIFDPAGNLFGTTEGGLFGLWGSVFELSPASGGSWSYSTVYYYPTVGGGDGYFPEAGLTLGQSGILYGTTAGGGAENGGTVFQLTPSPAP
ncbi:MAG: choice-of-anchor tandem repeat GloVer-containing protein [Candidatus Sulfotelmatobacter sp.]